VAAQAVKKNQTPIWWFVVAVLGMVVIAIAGLLIGLHPAGNSTVWIRFLGYHVVVARGGVVAAVAPIVLLPIAILLPAWAVIDASRTSKSTFTSIGRSKGRWVVMMVIVFLVGDASLLLLPIYYLIRVRPQLNRKQATALV
jgi:fumarate reductase subunit D